ncbi:MAG: hypothetical protein WCG95_03605 [bacterium]
MSKYTFTFRKDDIIVEFVTTDKIVVENQFQIWVDCASDYTCTHPSKPKKVTPPPPPPSQPVVSEPIKTEEPPQQHKEEVKQEAETEAEAEKTEVFDKASSLLKTINSIQNPSEEEKIIPEPVGFEAVLEKSIENPTFEPTRVKDQVFLNLIHSKNTTDKFHYLVITAYYLSEFEKMERFSLKQINAKLMQNLSEVIDHTTLQEAISQNLIELVPDLTGASEVGEYRLTHTGEDFFANKI